MNATVYQALIQPCGRLSERWEVPSGNGEIRAICQMYYAAVPAKVREIVIPFVFHLMSIFSSIL